MALTLILTTAGTPLLLIPSQTYRHPSAPTPAPWPGALRLAPETGTISVSMRHLPGEPTHAAAGFPPEILAHLAGLPGVWCVALDPGGAVLAEWPALLPDVPAGAAATLFPGPVPVGASAFADCLDDGIYAIASSQPPSLPTPASVVAYGPLSRVTVRPTPPAGGFFGAVADPLRPAPDEAPALAARLAAALATLRSLRLNGRDLGANLAAVADWGVPVAWAAAAPPARRIVVPTGTADAAPSPPPCGWDAATRTVYLAPTIPAALDVPYLAAGLYAAHAALSGQSALSDLCAGVVVSGVDLPSQSQFASRLAAEAARAWLLLAEVALALPPDTGAAPLLAQTPWAAQALDWLAPIATASTPASYEATVDAALVEATQWLAPRVGDAATAVYREAAGLREAWHSPARRATLPRPPALPAVPAPADAASVYVPADILIVTEHGTLPTITYSAPALAPVAAGLTIHQQPGAGPGTVAFNRADGVQVYLPDVAPTVLAALVSAGTATVIGHTMDGQCLAPQSVPVVRA